MSAIYVLDEIVLKPGMLQRYRQKLELRYLPGARRRGLQLLHSWVHPPVELQGESNRLLLLWRLDGPEAFWRMRAQVGSDPEAAAWWAESEPYTLARSRRFMLEAEDLAALPVGDGTGPSPD